MAKKAGGERKSAGLERIAYYSPDVPDYVVARLKEESRMGVTARGFAAAPGLESSATSLNKILGDYAIATISPHLPTAILPPAGTEAGRAMTALGFVPEAPALPVGVGGPLDRFVQIVPKSGSDAEKIARRLNRTAAVDVAYVAPRPVPAARPGKAPTRKRAPTRAKTGARVRPIAHALPPDAPSGSAAGSRNFEPTQGYLHDAPSGIGAMSVWSAKGGKGEGVTICDIEGNWNLNHEDLPAGIKLIGGTVIDDLGWRNHGTAVLGEMVSVPNEFGTVGISHLATAKVHSAIVGGVFNAAAAIIGAANVLKPGDAILIELHAPGPNGNYVAMQFWPDIFAAIQVAVAKGITVVEAAGNGGEDFENAIYKDSGLQRDSGAILVGAAAPPTNYFDAFGFGSQFPGYSSLGAPRSRLWFSNFGRQVNVQGWGWHVSTTGYGDLQGGASENTWYTARFSGTSSASPIVTGAVACLQGMAQAKNGSPLTPKQVRDILMNSGTPQQAGASSPLSQRIGPLPNLVEAAKLI